MTEPTLRHWLALGLAILLEVGGTSFLKFSQSWTFPYAEFCGLAVMLVAICLSYYCLARATTGLPVGVAFAFWEACGLSLIALMGFCFFHEEPTPQRILGLVCVLAGAMLVNRGTEHGPSTDERNREAAHD